MTYFESLLALLLAAVILLQGARRLSLPYPALLAAAGVAVAFVPGVPIIAIEPGTALALFIAPAIVDAAFDFPLGTARRFWAPLVAFAVFAVLATTALVAWVGWAFVGMPLAAAVAMGAIVAPPDAAAATAVLNAVSIPRSSDAVLKGETLFNDATALLLFAGALAVQSSEDVDVGVGLSLAVAAPLGILFGIASGVVYGRLNRFVAGTLGGTLLQFLSSAIVWILAERLHLSAVLAVVAYAMTLARRAEFEIAPRVRVHSYAVWSVVIFVLNVVAFLLMGMQVRVILGDMQPDRLGDALALAGMVVVVVVVARLAVVVGFNRLNAWRSRRRGEPEPATIQQAVLVGWCGMRGLVTLAAAFALPADFPQRETVVLVAFAVVLATLVAQGLTLSPLIHWLKLDRTDVFGSELRGGRLSLAEAALRTLDGAVGPEADHLRYAYSVEQAAAGDPPHAAAIDERRRLGLAAAQAERRALHDMRVDHSIGADAFLVLQEEIDLRELALQHDDDQRIEES
ncbi:cation:proton antiporter [Aureimonas leprariae]|uniref:Sodium:proton antiporter n=1 Tax=Plantimonas leprariae TaxID=2615207 RepID=A0A7V7TY03_9HYPH|nr:cation:proton antiporter [Aureimonas leprariae]KAB0682076.1 sodium:proton antiporter [Aureimonas leprariae]